MQATPEYIRHAITEKLHCDYLDIDGDGRHFFATIVSPEFEGLRPVMRHQRVYQALGERMKEEIHALSMKTWTPAEWAHNKDHPNG